MVEFTFQQGCLLGPGIRFKAACGEAGISHHKHEGDRATPAGLLTLLRVLYRADRETPPSTHVPLEPIGPHDGWCDDPASSAYNRPVRLPHPARHEALHRADPLYNIIGVLNWNINPAIAGRGSAIFLHVATVDYAPTAGCIALAPADLRHCLAAGLSAIRVVP